MRKAGDMVSSGRELASRRKWCWHPWLGCLFEKEGDSIKFQSGPSQNYERRLGSVSWEQGSCRVKVGDVAQCSSRYPGFPVP